MLNEVIQSIPHSERLVIVSSIQSTIPRERIRAQVVQGRSGEMWGFIWLDDLPFCFRAWPSLIHKKLDFLRNGSLDVNTSWGFVHAPYNPLSFKEPPFTTSINKDDMLYMLSGLRVRENNINLAIQNQAIPQLFEETLKRRQGAYQKFYELYETDEGFRMAYCTAVSIVCDEYEK